jgi:hypothetical protein
VQRFSCGQQTTLILGAREAVTLNKVARKKKIQTLAMNYIKAIGLELDIAADRAKVTTNVPEEDEQCQQVTQDGMVLRCICKRGHEGTHIFTGKGSASL